MVAVAVVAIGTAALAHEVGVSVALGAFVAGLALAESDLAASVLGEVVPLRELFATVFFVFGGHPAAAGRGAGGLAGRARPAAADHAGQGDPRSPASCAAGGHRSAHRPARRRAARPERRVQLRAGHRRPAARRAGLRDVQPGHGRAWCCRSWPPDRWRQGPRGWATGSGSPSWAVRTGSHGEPAAEHAAPRHRGRLRRRGPDGGPRAGGARHPVGRRRRRLPDGAPRQLDAASPSSTATPARPSVMDAAGIDQASTMVFAMDDPLAIRQAVQYALHRNQRLHIVARAHSAQEEGELRRLGRGAGDHRRARAGPRAGAPHAVALRRQRARDRRHPAPPLLAAQALARPPRCARPARPGCPPSAPGWRRRPAGSCPTARDAPRRRACRPPRPGGRRCRRDPPRRRRRRDRGCPPTPAPARRRRGPAWPRPSRRTWR